MGGPLKSKPIQNYAMFNGAHFKWATLLKKHITPWEYHLMSDTQFPPLYLRILKVWLESKFSHFASN